MTEEQKKKDLEDALKYVLNNDQHIAIMFQRRDGVWTEIGWKELYHHIRAEQKRLILEEGDKMKRKEIVYANTSESGYNQALTDYQDRIKNI